MPAITENVTFTHIAREWRCKWDTADDKASLSAAQKVVDAKLAEVKAIAGVSSVQRVVCGGCQDFKLIVCLDADAFGKWEDAEFAPEKDVLAELTAIEGIKRVETQTFTLETM